MRFYPHIAFANKELMHAMKLYMILGGHDCEGLMHEAAIIAPDETAAWRLLIKTVDPSSLVPDGESWESGKLEGNDEAYLAEVQKNYQITEKAEVLGVEQPELLMWSSIPW